MRNYVKCSRICVDVIASDESSVYSFDFYVKKEETAEMMFFIMGIVGNYKTPGLNISVKDLHTLPMNEVWTKEGIAKCMEESIPDLEVPKDDFQRILI